ncbi:hypothetical protein ACFS4T_19340 [Pseudomonas lini]
MAHAFSVGRDEIPQWACTVGPRPAVTVELGGWHEVTLTLAGSPSFIEMFVAKFSEPPT